MQNRPFIIGIAGPSGAGKSHFANTLSKALHAPIWPLDLYYKPRTAQQKDALGYLNFDLPDALDFDRLYNDFIKLRQYQSIEIEEYTFNKSSLNNNKRLLMASEVLIVEGIHIYTWEVLSQLIDFKIFIDAPVDLRLKRRISRDINERGYHTDEIQYRFLKHAEEVYFKHLVPIKNQMDLLIEQTENQLYPMELILPKLLAKKASIGL
jgi:uridine kinase